MVKIIEQTPLTLSEVSHLIGESDREKKVKDFIKKFGAIKYEKAMEMKKELEALDIMRLKEKNIVKIIDLMPEDASDLNKIMDDVSLDEEETNKVLDVVRKY